MDVMGLVSEVFEALLLWNQNTPDAWKNIIEHQDSRTTEMQGIDMFESRNDIQWDDPTLLFTGSDARFGFNSNNARRG